MRIKAIHEKTVQLQGNIANAVVDFSKHTVSLVAVVSDQVKNGKTVTGLAFNSIGRFAQGGIIRGRMIPRLMETDPASLLDPSGLSFNLSNVSAIVMRDEKPGGHGDRAGAAAALELAFWDLNAKLADEPAYQHIAQAFEQTPITQGAPVYAAGGYYYPGESSQRLAEELKSYQDLGYRAFKIKIGGASLAEDMDRIETAIKIAGNSSAVAVDANGRFDLSTALAYGKELAPYKLRWYEEPGNPLDYELLAELGGQYQGSIATGENIFSAADTQNLMRYARLHPEKDILQMDPGLSYGLSEYQKILNLTAEAGFPRTQCIPHGGHLINLHIVTALRLGGCEAYPGVFNPFGGYSAQSRVEDGRVIPSDAPGFGLEQKAELAPHINNLWESEMDIFVVGCGAMGSIYAALLASAGHNVSVVDPNADHINTINTRGLRVSGASGDRTVQLQGYTTPPAIPADLIICAVKARFIESAAASLQSLIGPHTRVLTIQNGLGSAEIVAGHVGAERLLVGLHRGLEPRCQSQVLRITMT